MDSGKVMTPYEACEFAMNNHECDLEKYQKIACQDPYFAFRFARYIPGADIAYCQRHACKDPDWIDLFITNIPGQILNIVISFCGAIEKKLKNG